MNLSHTLKSFYELTNDELYAILRLRSEVFVVEQNCPYLDLDNKDQKCHHLMLYDEDRLAAYCRLLPAGISFSEISIGRVISAPSHRGTGVGKKVMQLGIDYCEELFGKGPIRIGAQVFAKPFYEALGFVAEGEEYLEDDIPHVEMVRS
ncbi:MAG: GNAT family N-acetyltransferase [Algoriphagus sp.]|nr:GNAT family N-acetyltransferase [Algoriphagus sp.]